MQVDVLLLKTRHCATDGMRIIAFSIFEIHEIFYNSIITLLCSAKEEKLPLFKHRCIIIFMQIFLAKPQSCS